MVEMDRLSDWQVEFKNQIEKMDKMELLDETIRLHKETAGSFPLKKAQIKAEMALEEMRNKLTSSHETPPDLPIKEYPIADNDLPVPSVSKRKPRGRKKKS